MILDKSKMILVEIELTNLLSQRKLPRLRGCCFITCSIRIQDIASACLCVERMLQILERVQMKEALIVYLAEHVR